MALARSSLTCHHATASCVPETTQELVRVRKGEFGGRDRLQETCEPFRCCIGILWETRNCFHLGLLSQGAELSGPALVDNANMLPQRNLAENGGMLDEVIWLARTNKTQDLMWLDKMVATSSSYRRKNITYHGGDYRTSYDLVQNGTMYIKIDDDIVFIEDTTIPTLVESRLSHPERFIVSANIMNQPSLSWVHQHLGVVRPYLPELDPPDDWNTSRIVNYTDYSFQTSGNWRASQLPWWEGPSDFNYTQFFRHSPDGAFPGHRWLPVPYRENADGTPIQDTSYDAFSKGLWNWYIAAQEHYSFFEHLENNDLYKYKFPSWDYNYKRMGIQFVAMMGDDINAGKPIDREDDESYFSEVMPLRTGRRTS